MELLNFEGMIIFIIIMQVEFVISYFNSYRRLTIETIKIINLEVEQIKILAFN